MTVIKDTGLATFGRHWAVDAHYVSLIFDYRYFGASDGEPGNFVSLAKQLEDCQAVIRWARLRPELFLNNKIVLMGSPTGLAGVMAHCPILDGYASVMTAGFNPRLLFWAFIHSIKGMLGLSPLFIRAIGRPREFSPLNKPSSLPGFSIDPILRFTAMFAQGDTPFSNAPIEFMSARPGRKLAVPGGHFDIMEGGESFDTNIHAQIVFLQRLI
ncbi:alpha/beta-hydrolase [Mycena vulgaris]|nr:alpha/beta-hydrolase [Mycena vulgaris]